MTEDQLLRQVRRVIRRESPYRFEDAAIRAAVADIVARTRHPERQTGKIIRRAASVVMRGER